MPLLSFLQFVEQRIRDYKREYAERTPEQKSYRYVREKARKKVGLKDGDARECDHSKPLSKGGTNHGNNLKVVSRTKNRTKKNPFFEK